VSWPYPPLGQQWKHRSGRIDIWCRRAGLELMVLQRRATSNTNAEAQKACQLIVLRFETVDQPPTGFRVLVEVPSLVHNVEPTHGGYSSRPISRLLSRLPLNLILWTIGIRFAIQWISPSHEARRGDPGPPPWCSPMVLDVLWPERYRR
jgi:hypothetical protein